MTGLKSNFFFFKEKRESERKKKRLQRTKKELARRRVHGVYGPHVPQTYKSYSDIFHG